MAKKNGNAQSKLTKNLNIQEIVTQVKIKSTKKKNYTIRINEEVGDDFISFCKLHQISMSDLIEEVLAQILKAKLKP